MELVERLATLAHDQWSDYMKYFFTKGVVDPNGDFIITKDYYEAIQRQINTHYDNLTEEEKELDRVEARKVFDLVYGRN